MYQDNEDRGESLEQTEVRLFCVVRPPHLGSYRLEVYAKVSPIHDSIRDREERSDMPEIEATPCTLPDCLGKEEQASAVLISCVPLSLVLSKTFELVDHYKPARPFPTSLSHVWGCYPARFPDPEKKQMVINSRYRANIQTAVVENPRKGMVGLQQIRLPVLYDLVVKRSKQTVQIKIKARF